MICLVDNVRRAFLDAVVAQYIKNTDLNQYNTEEPVRIINGLPESNEQPDTSKEDNDNNHSTNGHDGQQQTPDSNNDDKDNTGHINDNDDNIKDDNEADSSNKDNVIEFPNKDHQKIMTT